MPRGNQTAYNPLAEVGDSLRSEDILELMRARSCEPFRIYMSDGATFDIPHPDMAIVQRSKVTAAVPGADGTDGRAERIVNCALIHITRTELVDGTNL